MALSISLTLTRIDKYYRNPSRLACPNPLISINENILSDRNRPDSIPNNPKDASKSDFSSYSFFFDSYMKFSFIYSKSYLLILYLSQRKSSL